VKLTLTPLDERGIYELGERVGWTASLPAGEDARGANYTYTVRKNNCDVIKSGELDLSSGAATIELTVDEPAMIYAEAVPADGPASERGSVAVGAAVAPTELMPVVPCPADFDAFWQTKIEKLHEVAENPLLTPGDSGRDDVDFAIIRMDHIGGAHVHGQLAKPKRAGKFPALLILQWASPPYPLEKSWVIGPAAQGWLTLNIEPHDVLPDQPQAYYDALPDSLKNYQSIGQADREQSYFLQMYLADYRAVDYLAARPDWDGKTLVVTGTSMGGQQSLCVAGLHPQITHVIVNEPAGCDLNAALHGRQAGYPNFPSDNAEVMQTARYFDAVNFAARIKARCLVSMGFVDTVTPPAGIWTAFNQIKGPKEAVPMVDSPHNHLATPQQQHPYTHRSAEWLDTLVRGGAVLPDRAAAAKAAVAFPAADQPLPRTDENSKIAHLQLLAKAKQGRIDVYFVGDSITRRWGCSDPQYAELLANWRENFFGWNAANFAWGGDSTQNILWRLENGELDGVNPKVIVIQAGTNNFGGGPADEGKIADVTRGIRAIVEACRAKAPRAKFVLTGIFPRNDNMAVIPAINEINDNIATLADGNNVRYLNVNDKLADADGRLFDGMMMDNLHPTVRGYQVWADGLKPILAELLGPPAKTDQAPPPTGDPSVNRAATGTSGN
jgi:cephalosporin-C deacetylase-like acetyl esterase/lysophospholipase L1-like esterase